MFTLVSSGADAYVLKRLLISYEDTRTRRDFLRNCAGAMAESGRIVSSWQPGRSQPGPAF